MNHGFKEDESNLPYSVSGKVDDIVGKLLVSDLEKFILKLVLLKFLKAMDCTGLEAREGFASASFIITRENEFLRTCNEFVFDHDLFNGGQLFKDCHTTHDYEGLFSNPGFRQLVDSVPYEFVDVSGGYEIRYDERFNFFDLVDEIDVRVAFMVDSKTRRVYRLDLAEMAFADYIDITV